MCVSKYPDCPGYSLKCHLCHPLTRTSSRDWNRVIVLSPVGPVEGAVAFDLMLDVGAKLARDLGGELRDAGRSSLTVQGIAQMREQLVLHGALAPRGAALSNFQSPPHTAPDHGHRGP